MRTAEHHGVRSDHAVTPARPGAWRRLRVAAVLLASVACVAAGLVTSPVARAADGDNPPAPGLPSFSLGSAWTPANLPLAQSTQLQIGSTLGAYVAGASDLKKVKMGIKLPITVVGVNLITESYYTIKGRSRVLGRFAAVAPVFVQSPAGVSPAWGVLPSITTTALAFGMIPVKTTVVLSQLRDASNLPIPFDVAVDSNYSTFVNYDVTMKGLLSLNLTSVLVDGRPLDVGKGCTTTTPVSLNLVGKNPFPPIRTPEFYYPPVGGDLYGTIDIPSFSGCVTSTGEDLSPLFTSALSGNSNPVHINQGTPGQKDLGCVPTTVEQATLCGKPDAIAQPTAAGQVPSLPPNYTPNPSPYAPPVILPPRPVTP